MEIREIKKTEMKIALELVWKTFLEFEAPDYTEEGINEFKKTIDDEVWISEKVFIGAFSDNQLLGVIALKDYSHISLFFVDGKHHRKGIGKMLYIRACELNKTGFYSVNSSPYAKGVYEHLGFIQTDSMQIVKGMKFYPMINKNIKNK